MMIPPPYTYAAGRLAEERNRDTMRHGEHVRLIRMARPVKYDAIDRLLARVGNVLVSSGEKLQARCPAIGRRLRERAIAPGPITRAT